MQDGTSACHSSLAHPVWIAYAGPHLSRMVFICFCLAARTIKLVGLPDACLTGREALKGAILHDLAPYRHISYLQQLALSRDPVKGHKEA